MSDVADLSSIRVAPTRPASRPVPTCPRCRQLLAPVPGLTVCTDPNRWSPVALFECPRGHGCFHVGLPPKP